MWAKSCCLFLALTALNCSRGHSRAPTDWNSAIRMLEKVYRNVDFAPMLVAASCDKPFLEQAGFRPYFVVFFGPRTDAPEIVAIRTSLLWHGTKLPTDDHFKIRVGTTELISKNVCDETPVEWKSFSDPKFHLVSVNFGLTKEVMGNLIRNIESNRNTSILFGDKAGNMWSLEIGARIMNFEKSRAALPSTGTPSSATLRVALKPTDVHPEFLLSRAARIIDIADEDSEQKRAVQPATHPSVEPPVKDHPPTPRTKILPR